MVEVVTSSTVFTKQLELEGFVATDPRGLLSVRRNGSNIEIGVNAPFRQDIGGGYLVGKSQLIPIQTKQTGFSSHILNHVIGYAPQFQLQLGRISQRHGPVISEANALIECHSDIHGVTRLEIGATLAIRFFTGHNRGDARACSIGQDNTDV